MESSLNIQYGLIFLIVLSFACSHQLVTAQAGSHEITFEYYKAYIDYDHDSIPFDPGDWVFKRARTE